MIECPERSSTPHAFHLYLELKIVEISRLLSFVNFDKIHFLFEERSFLLE